MGKNLKGKELGKCISQRKDGRYQARFTNRFGIRIEYKDNNLNKVKSWLNDEKMKDQMKMNIKCSICLDEWFEKWIDIYKYGLIRESTRSMYISVYRKHISPVIGKEKISDINNIMVRDLINNMDKNGYGFETRNRVKIMLSDMMDKAMIDDFVVKNPVKGIKLTREKYERRVLTEDEEKLLLDCSKGTFYDNLINLILNTGLRAGEAFALSENDIDFENNIIKVTKTLSYQKYEGDDKKTFHIGPPKTLKSKRNIPLSERARNALLKQISQKKIIEERNIKNVPEEYRNFLFTTKFNTPMNVQILSDALKKIIYEINLTRHDLEAIEGVTPHTLRHTFATRCIEAGIQPKVLQTMLGHASLQMTMDLYAHVTDEFSKEMIYLYDRKMNFLE